MLLLAGCASDYIIATTDGQMLASQDKPELDKKTGLIEYEDSEGRTRQIPKSQVRQIIER
ncbi:putative lipoprotein YgdR precursor [compost metagenome]